MMGDLLILATGSETRQLILRNAGVPFTVEPARIDEIAVRASLEAEDATAIEIAGILAMMKAKQISGRNNSALVLGFDQVLALKGKVFGKVENMNQLKNQLQELSDHTHHLYSAAVFFEQGREISRHVGTARLTMRKLSDDFIRAYIERNKDSLLDVVGGYQIEGEGAQLFSNVQGDYFSVLGVPLFPILEVLRMKGMLAT